MGSAKPVAVIAGCRVWRTFADLESFNRPARLLAGYALIVPGGEVVKRPSGAVQRTAGRTEIRVLVDQHERKELRSRHPTEPLTS